MLAMKGLNHFETAEFIKSSFVEFGETFVELSNFNLFCLIYSLQTAKNL